MLSVQEWSDFASRRQSLQVSLPVGIQHSTYWVQTPYRYSIPLLVVSSLMHLIISQSFFLVQVTFLDQLGQPIGAIPSVKSSNNIFTVPGYSPKAILAAIIVGGVMILVLSGSIFRRDPSAMPAGEIRSSEISAACHQPAEDGNSAYKNLMWGAIRHPDGDAPGHCCFTSHEVEAPIVGKYYGPSTVR